MAAIEVDRSIADGVELWRLNTPPVNAINPATVALLHQRLDEAEATAQSRAVVIASALPVFSAGGDARWMATTLKEAGPDGFLEEFAATLDSLRAFGVRVRRTALLVVAAIDGHALAGGVELAAACDLRFAADDDQLQIGVPEWPQFGQMPSGGGGVQYLTRLMGRARALQFILDGGPLTPREAREAGLVEVLCEQAAATSAVSFCARSIRNARRPAVSAVKRAVHIGSELSLLDALELDRSLHWDSLRRSDFTATVEAFGLRHGS